MQKHLFLVLMVSFCVKSAFSAEQQSLKDSFNRAKEGYFHKHSSSLPESGKAKALKRSSVTKVKDGIRQLLNKTGIKRNELPTAGGDINWGTESSGAFPIFYFNTAAPMVDSDGFITYVRWDFGDGSIMDTPIEELDEYAFIGHVFPSFGQYEVKLRIYDDAGEFSELSTTVDVGANTAPTAYFTQVRTTANNVNFTAIHNDPDNNVSNYRWDFGDGSPKQSTAVNTISHSFPASGAYWVSVDIEDQAGAHNRFTKQVYVRVTMPTTVNPYPITKLSAVAGTAPLSVDFDASLSKDSRERAITKFEWDFGDFDSVNNFSKSANPSHTFRAPGTYYVRLRIKDVYNNEVEKYFAIHVKKTVSVEPIVIAKQNSNSRFIEFEGSRWSIPVPFDPNHVFWDFGDGQIAQGEYVQHKYAVDGKYTVRMTVHDVEGKRHTVLHDLVVTSQKDEIRGGWEYQADHQNINENYSYNASGFEDPQGQPFTYNWNFSDGTLVRSTNAHIEHSFAQRGAYPVRVTAMNSRGLARDMRDTITVQDGSQIYPNLYYTPKVGNAPMNVSLKSDLAFTSNSNIVKVLWQFDDETYSESATLSRAYPNPGYYWARLYVRDAIGNESVSHREIIVNNPEDIPGDNEPPVGYFKIEKYGDQPNELAFKAYGSFDPDGEIKFIEWRLDNVLKTDGWEYYPYLTPGTHSVRMTARDEWNGNITVIKTFKVGTTNDAVLDFTYTPSTPVATQAVQFNAANTIVTGVEMKKYRWDFGDGVLGSGEVDQHTYSQAGTYNVKLMVTDLQGDNHVYSQSVVVGN